MGIQDVEPGAGQIVDVDPGAGKRYIKISVPNFNGDGTQMGSYLRIGATERDMTGPPDPLPPGVIDTTGEDLAWKVQGFADDTRIRTLLDANETQHPPGGGSLGDVTSALGATSTPLPDPETLPPATDAATALPGGATLDPPDHAGDNFPGTLKNRLAESGMLHRKGGWRDHSDGNRITTTRGDKVEVIRGNYRMVVLGRSDSIDQAAGWDLSGGLVDGDGGDLARRTDLAHDSHNIYNVEYRWEKDSNQRWGWTQTTITGSFDTRPDPQADADPPGNGKQVSITWVDEVQSFQGGPPLGDPVYAPPAAPGPVGGGDGSADGKKRVNRIYNRTWVNVLDEETEATGLIREVMRAQGPMINIQMAGWDAAGHSAMGWPLPENLPDPDLRPGAMTTIVASSSDMTTATVTTGSMTSYTRTISGGSMENHVNSAGSIENHTTSGGWIYETTTATGGHASFDMAFATIFNLTLATIVAEIKSIVHLDIHAGVHADFHVGEHFDVHTGDHTQIENFHNEIGLNHDECVALVHYLQGENVTLSGVASHLAGAIDLG